VAPLEAAYLEALMCSGFGEPSERKALVVACEAAVCFSCVAWLVPAMVLAEDRAGAR
jgi:hypothetical protein